jgi:hypothetical protein
MAHYAFIDENNIVTQVIVGIDETELIDGIDPESWYQNFKNQKCRRTSYNANIRFNYAGIGYNYDETADAFIAPMPNCGHEELILNETNYKWECENAEHDINLS